MTTMSPEQAARRAWQVPLVLFGVAALLLLVVFLWKDTDSGPPQAPAARSATSYDQEYGGGAGRYEAVLSLTDCTALGRMFSAGKANFDNDAPGGKQLWRGQMEVTADRMDALGCP